MAKHHFRYGPPLTNGKLRAALNMGLQFPLVMMAAIILPGLRKAVSAKVCSMPTHPTAGNTSHLLGRSVRQKECPAILTSWHRERMSS